MFDSLSGRLQQTFKALRGEARLTPESVEAALRDIRMALLEADVNFKVVKAFIDRVRDRAVDESVLSSLTPAQQVVKIVRDEMLTLFGDPGSLTRGGSAPSVVLLLGLQGSGKTTTVAKLGRWLAGQGRHPVVVSTDVRRPAAIEQLSVLAGQARLRVFDPAGDLDPVSRARGAVTDARQVGCDVVLVDTAGRLHIDDAMMSELEAIVEATAAADRLYVADAMTGQDAIKSAGEFNRRVGVTGVVLTKIDGDARGGAALSVVSVVGVPITFVGSGERLDDLEPFHPDRVVSRVLGMGDVLSLVERAEQAVTQEDAARLEQAIRRNAFTLEDFRDHLRTIRKMGPIEQIVGMLPGMGQLPAAAADVDPGQLTRIEAIIGSMTPRERRSHQIIDGRRRKRIARGSGRTVEEVNRMLKQFVMMRKMLKTIGGAAARGKRGRRGTRSGPGGVADAMKHFGMGWS